MIVVGLSGRAGAGKDTVAERLVLEHDFQAMSFAEPLWWMLSALDVDIERVASDRAYKDEMPLPDLHRTPRHLAQTLGTDWGRRMVHPDLWCILATRRLAQHELEHGKIERLVMTDVRFDNEAEWVRNLGGQIWHIVRINGPVGVNHSSEWGIHTKYIDRGLVNDKAIWQLHERVDLLVHELLAGQ